MTNWRPQLADGDFYIRDRHHYLFDEKQTVSYEETKYTEFSLTGHPTAVNSVLVDGVAYTDFSVTGNRLLVRHPDPNEWASANATGWTDEQLEWNKAGYTFLPTGSVTISYDVLEEGVMTGVAITTGVCSESFSFYEGTGHHSFPSSYNDLEPPFIFTDDEYYPTNARPHMPEFKVDPEDSSIVVYDESTEVLNPAFVANLTGQPLGWNTAGSPGLLRRHDSYYGKYVAMLNSGDGYNQAMYVDTGTQYTFSARMRKREDAATGLGYLTIDGNSVTGILTNEWTSVLNTFTASNGIITGEFGCASGEIEADGIMLKAAATGTPFNYIPGNATIEFEGNPTGLYHYESGPFDFDDIDLNVSNERMTRGFVTIGEYPYGYEYEPIGKGGYVHSPYPTGEFAVHRGTGELYNEEYYEEIYAEPTGSILSYTPGTGQKMFALINIGAVHTGTTEYSSVTGYVGTPNSRGYAPLNLTGAGYNAWKTELFSYIDTHVKPYNFTGVCLEGGNYGLGIPPYQEIAPQTGQMEQLAEEVFAYCTGYLQSLSGGERMFNTNLTGTMMSSIYSVLVDGLSIDEDFDYRSEIERNRLRTRTLDMVNECANQNNLDVDVNAFDYMPMTTGLLLDTVDERLINESREFAYNEDWKYYWGPEWCDYTYTGDLGTTDVLDNYALTTGETAPTTGIGRMHTPWGKISGYNKLRERETFHPTGEMRNPDESRSSGGAIPSRLEIGVVNSLYRGLEDKLLPDPSVSSSYTGGAWAIVSSWNYYGVVVGTNTDTSGKLYAEITCTAVSSRFKYEMNVYKDAAKTNKVCEGTSWAGDETTDTVILGFAVNSSGLSVSVVVQRGAVGGASGTHTITFTDPYSRDTNDDIYMSRLLTEEPCLAVTLRDTNDNPMDTHRVYAGADTGTITGYEYTDKSGTADFVFSDTGVLTGHNMAQIDFIGRGRQDAYLGVNLDYVGAVPTGLNIGANFYVEDDTVPLGTSVEFHDSSTGLVTDYLWDFGDGNTSTSRDPVHYYAATGLYTVSMTASSLWDSDTETKVDYVEITYLNTIGTGLIGSSTIGI